MFSRKQDDANEKLLTENNNNNAAAASAGVVYCCAQPSFVGAPTFEWSSLDTVSGSRTSCRKIVQRIFARIDTTSFGERRQYVDDMQNVQLFSIIGVDRCIFVVGCMKSDFVHEQDSNNNAGNGSVAVEMDRLLVQMQRAFAQYIARYIRGVRENKSSTSANKKKKNNNNNRQNDDDDDEDDETQGIDKESLKFFDQAIQQAIDESSHRISDIVFHNAVRSAQNQANIAANGGGLSTNNSIGGGLKRLLMSAGANNNNNNNATTTPNPRSDNNNANYYHESVAASYLSGATGADDAGGFGGSSALRRSILHHGDDSSDDDEGNAKNKLCCSTRAKFIICFVIVFIIAVVIFVLIFACEKRGFNDFEFSCS